MAEIQFGRRMNEDLLTLFSTYNAWVNERILSALSPIEVPEGAAASAIYKYGIEVLNHILVLDLTWLHRFRDSMVGTQAGALLEGVSLFARPARMDEILHHDVRTLAVSRRTVDSLLESFVGSLSTEQLAQTVTYRTFSHQPSAGPLGALLLHQFNHQTSHRGDVLALLPSLGVEIGPNDMIDVIGVWCRRAVAR